MITRKPRKLSKHLKYYKASEYRSFLLYYSLPVLHNVLPLDYWNHYALFAVSIYYLLQQSISEEQLTNSETILKKICSQFETLYGRRYMTANVHNLLHLADCIRELGPLWAYSCSHFESQNGALKSLVHGTQQVAKQIMASFAYRKNLSAAAAETIPETSVYFTAFEHLFLDHHHVSKQNCMKVNDNIFVMGKPIKGSLSEKEMRILVDHDISNYEAYSRILVHNIKIYSYNSNKNCSVKESNSTIAYYNKHCNIEYGVVQNIIVPKTEGDVSNVLLIYSLTVTFTNFRVANTTCAIIFSSL